MIYYVGTYGWPLSIRDISVWYGITKFMFVNVVVAIRDKVQSIVISRLVVSSRVRKAEKLLLESTILINFFAENEKMNIKKLQYDIEYLLVEKWLTKKYEINKQDLKTKIYFTPLRI